MADEIASTSGFQILDIGGFLVGNAEMAATTGQIRFSPTVRVDMAADEVEISFPPGGALMRGGDQMGSATTIRFSATARLRLTLPDLVPPVTVSPLYIRRISPIMPTVVGRNSRGEPLT